MLLLGMHFCVAQEKGAEQVSSPASQAFALRIRKLLRERFPALYASGLADYGLHHYVAGRWQALPASMSPRVVVLVHGLDEPGKLWTGLSPRLAQKNRSICELRYPNDQPIRHSAAFFLDCLCDLRTRGTTEVVVVAHSMGGLVSREMLTNPEMEFADLCKAKAVPVVSGLIMVGTPNNGSALAQARVFAEMRDQFMRLINGNGHILGGIVDGAGEAGKDLLPTSSFLRELNARSQPEGVRITIIAGLANPVARSELAERLASWRQRMPGNLRRSFQEFEEGLKGVSDSIGDGVVSLESTKISGVSDHNIVQGNHLSIIRNVTAGSDRLPPAVPIIVDRIKQIWELDKQKQ